MVMAEATYVAPATETTDTQIGFYQSELGAIPLGWTVSNLEQLTEDKRPISYGIVQTGPSVTSGVPCLRVVDIENGKVLKDNLITTSEEISRSYRRTILKPGDLVMPLRGKVGAVAEIDNSLDGANLTRGLALLAINPPNVPRFFLYLISGQDSQKRLDDSLNGSALKEIPIATLRAFKIAFPECSDEQEKIAKTLTDIDEYIDLIKKLIDKKRAIKQGAMQALLSSERRLPGFSGEWTEKTFGEIFSFGSTATNSRADLNENGDAHYIHYGDIHTTFHSHLDISRQKPPRIDRSLCPSATWLKNGDWLMADASEDLDGVGKAVEVLGLKENEIAVSGLHTFLLREKEPTFAPGFKGHLGNSEELKHQYMRVMTGMKVFGVSKAALKDLVLPIPDWDEQIAITKVLDEFEAEILSLEGQLAKAVKIKTGMMESLLTGKVRLV